MSERSKVGCLIDGLMVATFAMIIFTFGVFTFGVLVPLINNPMNPPSFAVAPTLPTATLIPTPDWMALPYNEICDTNDTLTDIQQEALAASMAGKRVIGWVGKVYDVERDGDLFKVQVEMVDGFISARDLEIFGVSHDVAERLNVEQEITFDGTILSVDMFMQDICNPINIVDAIIR